MARSSVLVPCAYRTLGDSSAIYCYHPRIRTTDNQVSSSDCRMCPWPGVVSSKEKAHSVVGETLPRRSTASPSRITSDLPGYIRPGTRNVYDCDVIVPYFRDLQWLPQAIDSILWQLSCRCHLHLINDASLESDAFVQRQYSNHPNISWYRNLKNLGPYVSVHQIWPYLKTPHVALYDADDIALPNRLWYSLELMTQEDADLFGGSMEQLLDPTVPSDDKVNREYVERIPILRSGVPTQYYPRGLIVNCTLVIKKRFFEELNGFAAFHCGADLDFATRAHFAGAKFCLSDRIVALRRVNSQSLSRGGARGIGTSARQLIVDECRRRLHAYQSAKNFNPRPYGALDAADPSLTIQV